MKLLKKAIAFLAVFLTVFGNGFFAIPMALAAGTLQAPNNWSDFNGLGVEGQYIGKYAPGGNINYIVKGDDNFHRPSGSTTYDDLGKPDITYVVIKAGNNNDSSGGGLFVYQIDSGGSSKLTATNNTSPKGSYNVRVDYNSNGYPIITAQHHNRTNHQSCLLLCGRPKLRCNQGNQAG